MRWLKRVLDVLRPLAIIFDVLLLPLSWSAIIWFRIARYWGVKRLPLLRASFLRLGLFPIVDHYYDPLFDYRKRRPQILAGSLDFRDAHQQRLLHELTFQTEYDEFPLDAPAKGTRYYYKNGSFEFGDAELYYALIRRQKPLRIVEIGSGNSTLMALEGIQRNLQADPDYRCALTCVEPYECRFLETLDVELIRTKVEDLPISRFEALDPGDFLFIDSSHIVRPGGDVLHLILGVLPKLKPGVWIHFHDIFLPDDYPEHWIRDEFRLWNEQYLLEAFLIGNTDFEIELGMSYLNKNHPDLLGKTFPNLQRYAGARPSSFWIRKK